MADQIDDSIVVGKPSMLMLMMMMLMEKKAILWLMYLLTWPETSGRKNKKERKNDAVKNSIVMLFSNDDKNC